MANEGHAAPNPAAPAACSRQLEALLCYRLISWMPADNDNFQSLPRWAAFWSPRCRGPFGRSPYFHHNIWGVKHGESKPSSSVACSGARSLSCRTFLVHQQQNLVGWKGKRNNRVRRRVEERTC